MDMDRKTLWGAPMLALLALLPGAFATEAIAPVDAGVAGCDDAGRSCGAIAPAMDGCTTEGALVAVGVSTKEDTVWRFRYSGSGFFGRTTIDETTVGPSALFTARYGRGIGIGYSYSASLSADGEIVASAGNDIQCR